LTVKPRTTRTIVSPANTSAARRTLALLGGLRGLSARIARRSSGLPESAAGRAGRAGRPAPALPESACGRAGRPAPALPAPGRCRRRPPMPAILPGMRVVVAPDKFEGSLTAEQAANAIEAGLRRARADVQVVRLPVGDGGAGTLAAVVAAGFERVPVPATGPTGEPVQAAIAVLGDRAFVEMAEASGLHRLPDGRRAPLEATTYGTGELLRAALDPRIAKVRVTVAADVDNPLVGPHGAAAVYGPQKGASPDDVLLLDSALRRYARVLSSDLGADLADAPGAGAAGGLGAGAIAFLGAELRSGIDLVLDLIGFHQAVEGADLVITGEGKIDFQSLRGKAPFGVARAAAEHGVPVVAVGGIVEVAEQELRTAGFEEARALAELEADVERSIAEAAPLLERLAEQVGRAWASLP